MKKAILPLIFLSPIFAFWGKPIYVSSNILSNINNVGNYLYINGQLVKIKPNLVEIVKITPNTGYVSEEKDVVIPVNVPYQSIGEGYFLKVCADPNCDIVYNFTYCTPWQCSSKPPLAIGTHIPINNVLFLFNISTFNSSLLQDMLHKTVYGIIPPLGITTSPSTIYFGAMIQFDNNYSICSFSLWSNHNAFLCVNNKCYISSIGEAPLSEYSCTSYTGTLMPISFKPLSSNTILYGTCAPASSAGIDPMLFTNVGPSDINGRLLYFTIFVKIPVVYNNTPIYLYIYKSPTNYGTNPKNIFITYLSPYDIPNSTVEVATWHRYYLPIYAKTISGSPVNISKLVPIIDPSYGPIYIAMLGENPSGGDFSIFMYIKNSTGTFPTTVLYKGGGGQIWCNGNLVASLSGSIGTNADSVLVLEVLPDGLVSYPLFYMDMHAFPLLGYKAIYYFTKSMEYKTQIQSVHLQLLFGGWTYPTLYIYSFFIYRGLYSYKPEYLYIKW